MGGKDMKVSNEIIAGKIDYANPNLYRQFEF